MSVDEVITTNIPTKGNDMNIKTEFEQFLAGKAEEFVSKKANMTIAEFRELNAVLDSCGIDFSNLPPNVKIPATKPIVSGKRTITRTGVSTQAVREFILDYMRDGSSYTSKDIIEEFKATYANQLKNVTEANIYAKVYNAMTDLRSLKKVRKTNRIENTTAWLYQAVPKRNAQMSASL
jgi:hypothetical protein